MSIISSIAKGDNTFTRQRQSSFFNLIAMQIKQTNLIQASEFKKKKKIDFLLGISDILYEIRRDLLAACHDREYSF